MKRIVVYSTQLMETGGIESHMLEFCMHMSKGGLLIDLVVLNSSLLPETEQLYRKVCHNVYLGNQGRSYGRLGWLVALCLKLRLRKYDALYTNGQGESIGLLGSFLRVKGPWVHHHHTSGDAEDQKTWGAGYVKVLKKSSTVIACSSRNGKDMAAFLKRQIDSIPCFSRKITVPNVPKTGNGKVKLGYYGRLIPEKGIDLICKMSGDPELDHVEFHVWGKGDAYPASFFNQYTKLQYHGTFSGLAGLESTIASLDGFLLLSVHPEGLPICLLEAMSAGLPWLATDRGGITDIACDPVSTRVIPASSDYEQMKLAVKALAEDIALGKVSKDLQEQLYADKFSATALVNRWSEALRLN